MRHKARRDRFRYQGRETASQVTRMQVASNGKLEKILMEEFSINFNLRMSKMKDTIESFKIDIRTEIQDKLKEVDKQKPENGGAVRVSNRRM